MSRTIWTIPTGIPAMFVILRGVVSASVIILTFHPVGSLGIDMKPEMVSAAAPQRKRKISRLHSIYLILKGRTRTRMNIITRPRFARRSTGITM